MTKKEGCTALIFPNNSFVFSGDTFIFAGGL